MDFCLWCLNGQWSIVPLGTTEYRQAVECIARNPCIHDHNDIKSAEGTTEVCFCRTFGALIFLQSYFAGIPHCVLHHLPIFCRPYRTFLLRASSLGLRAIARSLWLIAQSLLFLNEALYCFTVCCNDFHEVNSAVQTRNIY